jgi:uncharacterized protein (UPF0297 family)
VLKKIQVWCRIVIYQKYERKEHGKMAENSINNNSSLRTDGDELRDIMKTVYSALSEKGYNPVNQLVGYILSEDPTYITSYKGARALIRKVDRDELLACLIRNYLNN